MVFVCPTSVLFFSLARSADSYTDLRSISLWYTRSFLSHPPRRRTYRSLGHPPASRTCGRAPPVHPRRCGDSPSQPVCVFSSRCISIISSYMHYSYLISTHERAKVKLIDFDAMMGDRRG
ncbi:hypothetical protein RSAG8_05854, partial [Rhizoctonia solani AG-8 WAC10335]